MLKRATVAFVTLFAVFALVAACGDSDGGVEVENQSDNGGSDLFNDSPPNSDEEEQEQNTSTNDDANATTNDSANDTTNDANSANDPNGANGTEPAAQYCVNECTSASDCTPDGGDEADWACEDGACKPDQCDVDGDCEAASRGWYTTCQSNDECEGQVCFEFEGTGYCALEESEEFACDEIDGMIPFDGSDIEGNDVTVCGYDQTYECFDGICADPESTGEVEPQCDENSDCDELENADTCYDGICGCSGDEVCDDGQTCAAF